MKLRLFATRLNDLNCRQIMMKSPHSCASATGPHRVSSCNAVPMNQAATRPRGDGRVAATTTPATRAICYFALSATRSLIKRPLRVVRPQYFSSPAATYDIPRLAAVLYSALFFLSISAFDLSFASRSAPTSAPCAHQTLQDGLANPKATRFRQCHPTYFQKIRFFERNLSCYDAKLKYCITRKRSSILDPSAVTHYLDVSRKSKFLIFDRDCDISKRLRE